MGEQITYTHEENQEHTNEEILSDLRNRVAVAKTQYDNRVNCTLQDWRTLEKLEQYLKSPYGNITLKEHDDMTEIYIVVDNKKVDIFHIKKV